MAIRNRIETSPEKACADSLNSQSPILRTKPLSLGTMTFDAIEKTDMPWQLVTTVHFVAISSR